MTKDRKFLCYECAKNDKPFYIAGFGTPCYLCGKQANGEFEKDDQGNWVSFVNQAQLSDKI